MISTPFLMKTNIIITFCIVCFLSLIPPIEFVLHNPPNPYWAWMILICGFLGFFTLFIKTDHLVKAIAILGFVSCFFSSVPYLSFTSYVSLLACCYLYIFASKIGDWTMMQNGLQIVVLLNLFLFFMQLIGRDPILNFGMPNVEQYGAIGQHMQMGSFAVIISAALLTYSKMNILFPLVASVYCHSGWTFFCVLSCIIIHLARHSTKSAVTVSLIFLILFSVWGFKSGKFQENISDKNSSRVAIWKRSLQLSLEHPFTGWGIGTYKDLFPPMSSGKHQYTPYKTAHNFIVQLLFETGFVFTALILIGISLLIWNLFANSQWLLLSGLLMILFDALVHFPDRMIQTVPIIVIYLAMCKSSLRRFS